MNNQFGTMFSPPWLGEQDELFKFITSPPNCEQQQSQLQRGQENINAIVNPSHLFGTDHKVLDPMPKIKTPSHRRKLSTGGTLDNAALAGAKVPKDSLIKKILHRDVERQRRLEMSLLCQNLHSLIPSAYLQKRRSMTDHLDGTIKYIMHMKNKVEELKNKREKLQNAVTVGEPCLNVSHEQPIIKVKNCKEGMEIAVNIGINNIKDLPLSKILKTLLSEGMSIKTCTSTRVHERLLHVIESEVKEDGFIDPDELCRKLMGKDMNETSNV